MVLKNFIVLEGIDGAGTTTQQRLLQDKIRALHPQVPCHSTAEPTDGATGRFLRSVLRGEVRLSPRTVAYLFAADRQEHLAAPGGIEELCRSGSLVICDRYLFSSLAYQSAACGPELPRMLNSGFPLPACLLFLDIEPDLSLKRISGRSVTEIYENRAFLEAAATEYRRVVAEYEAMDTGMTIVRLDASQGPEKVAADIWSALENMPILQG